MCYNDLDICSLNLLGSNKDIKSEDTTKPSTEELHISTSESLTAEIQTSHHHHHHHQPSISLALPLHTSHFQAEVPDDDLTPTEGGNFSTPCDAIQQSCLGAEVQPWFKGLLTMDDFNILDEHRSDLRNALCFY